MSSFCCCSTVGLFLAGDTLAQVLAAAERAGTSSIGMSCIAFAKLEGGLNSSEWDCSTSEAVCFVDSVLCNRGEIGSTRDCPSGSGILG